MKSNKNVRKAVQENNASAVSNEQKNVSSILQSKAEDVEFKEVAPTEEAKPEATQAETTQVVETITEQPKEETPKTEVATVEAPKLPSFEELKQRSAIMYMLNQKHDELIQKRNNLQKFTITHDDKNVSIEMVDSNGMRFRSSIPTIIGEFINICMRDYEADIKRIEEDLTKTFAA